MERLKVYCHQIAESIEVETHLSLKFSEKNFGGILILVRILLCKSPGAGHIFRCKSPGVPGGGIGKRVKLIPG